MSYVKFYKRETSNDVNNIDIADGNFIALTSPDGSEARKLYIDEGSTRVQVGGDTGVIDNLTSTSTNDALSANQGKKLEDYKRTRYTSLSDFNLSTSDTLEDIVLAMATNSIFTMAVTDISTTMGSQLPENGGVLTIEKMTSTSRNRLTYTLSSTTSSATPKMWVSYVKSINNVETLCDWEEVLFAEEGKGLSSNDYTDREQSKLATLNFSSYTTLSSLGVSTSSSLLTVFNAVPLHSMLNVSIDSLETTLGANFPVAGGVLTIEKYSNTTRNRLIYTLSSVVSSTVRVWYARFQDGATFSGWAEINSSESGTVSIPHSTANTTVQTTVNLSRTFSTLNVQLTPISSNPVGTFVSYGLIGSADSGYTGFTIYSQSTAVADRIVTWLATE